MNMLRKLFFFFFCLLWTGSIVFSGSPAAAASEAVSGVTDETVLEDGITSLGEDLSGLTLGEARSKINRIFESLADSMLTVTFDGQAEQISLRELGLSWNADSALADAAALGKSGSFISRYKEKKDLKAESRDVDIVYTYDVSAIENFVRDKVAVHDTEPVEATLIRDSSRNFVVTDDVHGMKTDVDATVASISRTLDQGLSGNLTVEASVNISIADVTGEMLSAVQDKLGTYHTDYSSSSSERKTNIRIAAERINGTVLMPGESFSLSRTILARTPENGYEMAPQYVNGDTELSYGGGVCQVSTTLYNAVIRAELQIDERHPHSMVVNYVPYSSDAAISEGNKDFRFTNNLSYPVYLASDADGSDLYFSVYGKETRPENRTVEFVSDTISYTEMEPKVVEDPELAYGEERSEGSTHPAVVSTLTKVVKENGQVVSRDQMNYDDYMGTSKTIYRGSGDQFEEELEENLDLDLPLEGEDSGDEDYEEPEEEETKSKKKKNTEEFIEEEEIDEELILLDDD